ncbi:GNAT family N-acetyltransferase [Bacillus sp. SCS-151]|uniref:GNAT family N-acetyltransferase n=1 Tax=Nanhaiella sioensis TaxID=3115293 RepID=UPI0039784D1A
MLEQLHKNQYEIVEHFFRGHKQYIPALSVIYGNYPGKIFVDSVIQPNFAIVWALGRWLYCEGDIPKNHTYGSIIDSLWQFLKIEGKSIFEIYKSENQEWEKEFSANLSNLDVKKHWESLYTLNIGKFRELDTRQIESQVDCQIDQFPIVTSSCKEEDCELINETRFGSKIIKNNKIIAVCKNNGFVHNESYFISVETFDKNEQGKGYATVAGAKLIEYGLARNFIPLWETTHDNIASHKLATKLGFERNCSYPVYAFHHNSI